MQSLIFRDPAKLLEWAQRHLDYPPCNGCRYWFRLWNKWVLCLKHDGRAEHEVYRCKDFERRKDKTWK